MVSRSGPVVLQLLLHPVKSRFTLPTGISSPIQKQGQGKGSLITPDPELIIHVEKHLLIQTSFVQLDQHDAVLGGFVTNKI